MSIDSVKINESNPRKITESQMDMLVNSIQEFPEMLSIRPIVVNKDMVVLGGNMRFQACMKAGMKEIEVIVADSLTEAQEREFIIKDNVSGGEWDWDELVRNWEKELLEKYGLDTGDVVFDDVFEAIEDEYQMPDEIKTDIVRGDLFEIGEHRLLCGDSTNSDDVAKLMNGEKANMVFTSPPYWVGFTYENENQKDAILQHIHDVSVNMVMFTDGKIVINTGNIASITTAQKITGKKQPALLVDWWMEAMNKNDFLLRHIRVWTKQGVAMPSRANDKIDMSWEYIALFTDEDNNAGMVATFKKEADKSGIKKGTPEWAVNGVWNDIQGAARGSGHVAAFPVELVDRYAQMYTGQGDLFFEPYGGSGTTMVAAHQIKRKCFAMEYEPKYCEVIVQRMHKLDPNLPIKRNGQEYKIGK